MNRAVFLGSGGGRWASITQRASTAGFRLELGDEKIHVDPGPGAILRYHELHINPQRTDAIFCSHCHLDHYNDLTIMVEAMCMAKKRPGVLLGSESVINGFERFESPLTEYHRELLSECKALSPGDSYSLDGVEIEAKKSVHEDPKTIGAVFTTNDNTIAYVSDTTYFDGIAREYPESDVLIINVMRPDADRIPWHLCTKDVISLISEVKPKLAIMNHFGLKMLSAMPDAQAAKVQKETDVRTIAAKDGLRVDFPT